MWAGTYTYPRLGNGTGQLPPSEFNGKPIVSLTILTPEAFLSGADSELCTSTGIINVDR